MDKDEYQKLIVEMVNQISDISTLMRIYLMLAAVLQDRS